MAYIEKIEVTDTEKELFRKACKEDGRSMRQQAAKLIRDYLISRKA